MATTIKGRQTPYQKTAAALAAENDIPLQGERVRETDTGREKTGDGETHYNDLRYDDDPVKIAGSTETGLTVLTGDAAAGRGALGAGAVGGGLFTAQTAAEARLAAQAVGKSDLILNILDYGVVRGTTSSQTVAIKAAFDANPGKAFYFPPGDYRLDTQLNVTANNVLCVDGRIYAGAAMGILINYDNGEVAGNSYAQDRYLVGGGTIDGNLLAATAVAVGAVIRFRLGDGLTIVNPVNRGVWLKPAGAEVYCNARIHNTTTGNWGSRPSVTTTAGSTAITGTFLATDAGYPIVGTGIPVGAILASVTNGTTAVLSRAATASGTVTASILSSVGVDADMGDCTLLHMAIRDFTVGVWDKGNNRIVDVHPWIGTTAHQTVRYPDSVGFLIGGNSILTSCESDTFRYNFRTNHPGRTVSVTTNSTTTVTSSAGFTSADLGSSIVGDGIPAGATIVAYANSSSVTISATATASATVTATILGSAKVQFTNCRAFANTGNLTDVIAAANPGVVYDIRDGARVVVTSGRYQGHGTTAHAWLSGSTSKFTATDPIDDVPGSVNGIAEYKRGVRVSAAVDFSPTLYGHVLGLGSVTYTTRAGRMEVRDGMVTYSGRIVGSLGSDAAGNYRIGNLPFPTGAMVVQLGTGGVTRRAGIADAFGMQGANGFTGPLIATLHDGSGSEIAVTPSQAFDVHFNITCPFTYPS